MAFDNEAAVTELALLRLLPPNKISGSKLKTSLSRCLQVLRGWDSRPFYMYTCLEDPRLVYIIGSWASVAQYRDDFLPSPQNQALLDLLQGKVSVEWMFHLDIPIEVLPLDAPVISMYHYSLLPGMSSDFAAASARAQADLATYGVRNRFAQGRRIEGVERQGHEMTVFVGWDSQRSSNVSQPMTQVSNVLSA